MGANDVVLLDKILAQAKAATAAEMNEADFFEIWTAEQILKDDDLSYEEVQKGVIGNGNDGGIDSFYVFINGELLDEDTGLDAYKKDIVIDLVFIQSKTSKSFQEDAIDKFASSFKDLFDFTKDLETLKAVYNDDLRRKVGMFRVAYGDTLAGKFPTLRFRYYYATKGDKPHDNVTRKAPQLAGAVKGQFNKAEVSVYFLGATELFELAQRRPQTSFQLKLAENPLSAAGKEAFLTLVELKDYYDFLVGKTGHLQKHLLDANVRDYQGENQVNQEIQASLVSGTGSEDFWWLNNGITILASQATSAGAKVLTIENPFVVNGLQTSNEIYKYFKDPNFKEPKEKRHILVRIIKADSAESRDRIIKATNSQTAISPASLRATDPIHRKIEEYLKDFGLFYDRRKNSYKNDGKPIAKIISIGLLAQSIIAIVLRRPHDARARPSTLLKNDDDYKSIFDPKCPYELYKSCLLLIQKTDAAMKLPAANLEQRHRNNLRFHIPMYTALKFCENSTASVDLLLKKKIETVDDAFVIACIAEVKALYDAKGATDQIAKSAEFTAELLAKLQAEIAAKHKAAAAAVKKA